MKNGGFVALAYSMLGSVEDAEEVVQEARLRLHVRSQPPDDEAAFLYRVVSNLCVDRLRVAKRQRAAYVGPWLPEPWEDEQLDTTELDQDLSMGFLFLLECLSPPQRIAFVLREAFDFSFDEIGDLLAISPATARQRVSRARKRLATQTLSGRPRMARREVLEMLVTKVRTGDVEGLIAMLDDEVVAYTDGGGVASAALVPIEGVQRLTAVLMHLSQAVFADRATRISIEECCASPAVVVRQGRDIHSVTFVELDVHDRGVRVFVVRNPDKLLSLAR
ncbi:MAG: sigma-70 family RNA polymerase sigma factor [Pseudomonadota bacterium]